MPNKKANGMTAIERQNEGASKRIRVLIVSAGWRSTTEVFTTLRALVLQVSVGEPAICPGPIPLAPPHSFRNEVIFPHVYSASPPGHSLYTDRHDVFRRMYHLAIGLILARINHKLGVQVSHYPFNSDCGQIYINGYNCTYPLPTCLVKHEDCVTACFGSSLPTITITVAGFDTPIHLHTIGSRAETHPLPLHFEEFRTVKRFINGVDVNTRRDASIKMQFRNGNSRHLIHCHNMVHEDAFKIGHRVIYRDQSSPDACLDDIVWPQDDIASSFRGERPMCTYYGPLKHSGSGGQAYGQNSV